MSGQEITITTEDGSAQARVFGETGAPGIVLYSDIFGPRPAIWQMAERMAGFGTMVLVPDLFYRMGPYELIDPKTGFAVEETRTKLRAMIAGTTQFMTARDGAAFFDALEAAGAEGPMGTVGYCFGGGRAISAAAAHADKVRLAASFHGGNLATDDADSPHMFVSEIRGMVYVGAAEDDHGFPPEQAAALAEALSEARGDHILEQYKGMKHGWCVPDHGVYDAAGAERHWNRLEMLIAETLS